MDPRIRILYLAGAPRSGSTLVARLLAGAELAFSAGELRYFGERGLGENWACGCGRAFRECQVWSPIAQRVFETSPLKTPAAIEAASERVRLWHGRRRLNLLNFVLQPTRRRTRRLDRDFDVYRKHLSAVYSAVAGTVGKRLIIDSSKDAVYAAILASLPGVDLRVVHLVRDARAVAFSRAKRRKQQVSQPGQQFTMDLKIGVFSASWFWVAANLAIERLLAGAAVPFMRLRYEDFVADPLLKLADLAELAGTEFSDVRIEADRTTSLTENHIFSGNPDRLAGGQIEIRDDQRWRSGLTRGEMRTISFVAGRYQRKYGYEHTERTDHGPSGVRR